MMKYLFCYLLLFSQIKFSFAQTDQDTLLVVPAKNNMYFYHIANKGETLYSLSREFQVDVKKLASFNKLTLQTPLKIYQLVKIPLNNKNLDQSVNANAASGLKPLYHKVIKGETLYHISQINNKAPLAALKKWNHLPGNEVKVGQYIIVGWLNKKGKNDLAAAQKDHSTALAENKTKVTAQTGAPDLSAQAEKKVPVASEKKQFSPSAGQRSTSSSGGGTFLNEVIAAENKKREKEVTENRPSAKIAGHVNKKVPVVVQTKRQPAKVAADNDAFSVQSPPPAAVKAVNVEKKEEESSPQQLLTKKEEPTKPDSFALMLSRVTSGPKKKAASSKGTTTGPSDVRPDKPKTQIPASVQAAGELDSSQMNRTVKSEFQALYNRQTNNNTNITLKKGAAGWFHSNVKPGSGRYYALCDDLPRGTVVKVINPINQKSVLVKVLDVIPKQKENYNLLIKLSDAAMGDLGVSQSRFWCEISYAKNDK